MGSNGSNHLSGNYWSSSENNSDNGWNFNDTGWNNNNNKSNSNNVRSCLASCINTIEKSSCSSAYFLKNYFELNCF
ncbi:MAG TPA: hypothetical protein DHV83_03960 [Prevotella sp.]|nr:hypothetical protein [Prevotella sp.]